MQYQKTIVEVHKNQGLGLVRLILTVSWLDTTEKKQIRWCNSHLFNWTTIKTKNETTTAEQFQQRERGDYAQAERDLKAKRSVPKAQLDEQSGRRDRLAFVRFARPSVHQVRHKTLMSWDSPPAQYIFSVFLTILSLSYFLLLLCCLLFYILFFKCEWE